MRRINRLHGIDGPSELIDLLVRIANNDTGALLAEEDVKHGPTQILSFVQQNAIDAVFSDKVGL
jgi:hypothetical protein